MHIAKTKSAAAFWAGLFIGGALLCAAYFSWYSTRFIPVIHDEASYLFQARTFLLGRTVNPVHPEKLFFDQYHIINEGVYASKYFPGFALTIVPFLLLGYPYLNPVFFYGLHLVLIFLIGRELYGSRTAWFGMLLAAVSPQIFLHNAMLLNHAPGACFLLISFYGILRSIRGNSGIWMTLSGAALGFAFLIRPLTAGAFAIPLFIYWMTKVMKGKVEKPVSKAALGLVPLLAAVLVYGFYNQSVTGHFFKAPFDLYADIHTPYHRYGFDQWLKHHNESYGPRVDKYFNEYYHNHTLLTAFEFAGVRLAGFTEFLFGSITLGAALLMYWFWSLRKKYSADILIFSFWAALQAVHFPHFYPGIMSFGSNYLYEASGLVILSITNSVLVRLNHPKVMEARKAVGLFLLGICITFSIFTMKEMHSHFLRGRAMKIWLAQQIAARGIDQAVIFLRYPPHRNINFDLTENVPNLDSRIVFALDRGNENVKLKPYFPYRDFYLWDVETAGFEKILS